MQKNLFLWSFVRHCTFLIRMQKWALRAFPISMLESLNNYFSVKLCKALRTFSLIMQNKGSWLFRVIISLERLKKLCHWGFYGKNQILLKFPKFVLAIGSIESHGRHLEKARSLSWYGRCPSLKTTTLILKRQLS